MAAKNIGVEKTDKKWHAYLLAVLKGMLTDDEVRDLKHLLGTAETLTLNELGNCRNFFDVWISLERARKLAVGEYDELSEVMEMLKRMDCVGVINEHKGKIEDYRAKKCGGEYLLEAAKRGDTAAVLKLLSEAVDVNYERETDGWTALMLASYDGHLAVVDALLKVGAEIDKENKRGWTALILACEKGRLGVVDALMKGGADIDKEEEDGWTALMLASQFGHKDVANALMKAGVGINKENKEGGAALIFAAQNGRIALVDALIEGGAEIDKTDEYGGTALMLASQEGHIDVVDVLLKGKAEIGKTSKQGNTALSCAEREGHKEVAELLKKFGAKR